MRRFIRSCCLVILTIAALSGCVGFIDQYPNQQAAVDAWAAALTSAIDHHDIDELAGTTTNAGMSVSAELIRDELPQYLISGQFHADVIWQPDPEDDVYEVCLDGEGLHLAKRGVDALFAPSPIEQTLLIRFVERSGELLVDEVTSAGRLYCIPPVG